MLKNGLQSTSWDAPTHGSWISTVEYSTVQYSSRVSLEACPEADCGQGEAGAAAECEAEPGGAAEGATLAAVVHQCDHQQTHPAPARS